MTQDHWLFGFNYNVEEWDERHHFETLAICRQLAHARAVFKEAVAEKPAGRFMIRSRTTTRVRLRIDQSSCGTAAIWLVGIGAQLMCYPPRMLRVIGALVFLVLASTVATLATEHFPAGYATAVALLVPLLGFVAAWWAFAPDRKREP